VNNAGIAVIPKSSELADLRHSFNTTFNANITSVAAVTSVFLPLLRRSSDPRVIHVSSGRGSLQRTVGPDFPPTIIVAYSISKTALNALTVEQQKVENARTGKEEDGGKVDFYTINPGHCKTAFNGYRGHKDPIDGAEVVVQLVMAKRGEWKAGSFLEFEDGAMREVPW
jgi:NAD(P)-dependent dehydrogenase (short-subunit alcohol dehydrogenase family)